MPSFPNPTPRKNYHEIPFFLCHNKIS